MDFEIGIVSITYDENGIVKQASFEPHRKVEFDETILKQINRLETDDAESIKKHADFVLGAWFSKVTTVELSDPTEYKVDSEVVECQNFPSGGVSKCVIRYIFRKI